MNAVDLQRAIAGDQLILAYQPIIDVATADVVGVEALVRWQHPRRGLVPPLEFIGLAEQSGLIDELTGWVIRTGLAQWRRWQAGGFLPQLALNVSAINLAQRSFPDTIAALCDTHGVPCRMVTIEITESATHSIVDMMETSTRLRLKGFRISIDDFGTGYSSLVQLRDLPFSEMKIDKSFVMAADVSKHDRVIVKTIVDLAHNLSLGVVAEGVERAEVLDLLKEFGCDTAQGYHIARPMSGDGISTWLGDRGGHRSTLPLQMMGAP